MEEEQLLDAMRARLWNPHHLGVLMAREIEEERERIVALERVRCSGIDRLIQRHQLPPAMFSAWCLSGASVEAVRHTIARIV